MKENKNDVFDTALKDKEMEGFYKKKEAEDKRMKGNEYIKSKDYTTALRFYNKSLELDNTVAATYCNRALVFLKTKEYQNCIRDTNKAIELNPNYVKAYHRRG